MLRRHWDEFIIFKGKNYNWTKFQIKYENAYVSPMPLYGIKLIIYCEKYGDVAKGKFKIYDDNREYSFIASYQYE